MSVKTRVIAVANNKGGTGKTTTAASLADGLAKKLFATHGGDRYVLLVDLDPQGNLADTLGLRKHVWSDANPEGVCISDLLLNDGAKIWDFAVSADRADEGLPRPNLYLVPASRKLEAASDDLVMKDFNHFRRYNKSMLIDLLKAKLAPAMGRFDFVVIDCPPKLDVLKTAVYQVADHVIVPTKTEHLSVVGAVQHTNDLTGIINDFGVKARLLYVFPTMFDKREIASRQMFVNLQKAYRENCFEAIPMNVKVKEASGRNGRTIFEHDPTSAAGYAYARLVERVYTA